MTLEEFEEDHRQRVATVKINEAELMDNRSLFIHHSSEINLFKKWRSDRSQKFVQDGVNLTPIGTSLTDTCYATVELHPFCTCKTSILRKMFLHLQTQS